MNNFELSDAISAIDNEVERRRMTLISKPPYNTLYLSNASHIHFCIVNNLSQAENTFHKNFPEAVVFRFCFSTKENAIDALNKIANHYTQENSEILNIKVSDGETWLVFVVVPIVAQE